MNRQNKIISFRVTEDEYLKITNSAKNWNMHTTTYIKSSLLLEKEGNDTNYSEIALNTFDLINYTNDLKRNIENNNYNNTCIYNIELTLKNILCLLKK